MFSTKFQLDRVKILLEDLIDRNQKNEIKSYKRPDDHKERTSVGIELWLLMNLADRCRHSQTNCKYNVSCLQLQLSHTF